MKQLAFRVYGRPVPQGSKNIYKGRPVEQAKALAPWRQAVSYSALQASKLDSEWESFAEPVRLDMTFLFERPRAHFGTGRNSGILKESAPARYKGTTPDLSKLIRAVEDGITDVGVWTDDNLVAAVYAEKVYAALGEPPGVSVRISAL